MQGYKAILKNSRVYQEIELHSNKAVRVSVGTNPECSLRFQERFYFGPFQIDFICQGNQWFLSCSDEIYVTIDGISKRNYMELQHGCLFSLRKAGVELFQGEFLIDFEEGERNYNQAVHVASVQKIMIGGAEEAEIQIQDSMLGEGYATLSRTETGWLLEICDLKYGAYVNGNPVEKQSIVKNYDFFSLAKYNFFVLEDKLYTEQYEEMKILRLDTELLDSQTNSLQYPAFNRGTRIKYQIPQKKLEVLPPEKTEERKQKSILFSLIPSMVMLGMTILVRGVMSESRNLPFIIYSVVNMSVGIGVSIATYFSDKKAVLQENKKKRAVYAAYIEEKEKEIEYFRTRETEILNTIYLSMEENIENVKNFDSRLYEKSPSDEDFLVIRLGTGQNLSANQITVKEMDYKNQDFAFEIPGQIAEKYKYIENVPIVMNFREAHAIGLVGADYNLLNLVKIMVMDIAVRHFYREVKMICLMGEEFTGELEWLRWLPHFSSDKSGIRYLAYNEESWKCILEELYIQLSEREKILDSENGERGGVERLPYYVVFVFHSKKLAKHPVSRYFKNASQYGFTFVFCDNYPERLPMGCNEIVYIRDDGGTIQNAADGMDRLHFSYSILSERQVNQTAFRLSGIHIDEVNLEAGLTKNITLYQLMNIMSAQEVNLAYNWEHSKIYQSMLVPIGVKSGNETVFLDISDKPNGHGPHGLVAGMTGSGKSELLQTFILSMAMKFHPYDVGFMIIDFKGGGMANQFLELPHLLGNITNIDGREINRSLLSIKAESLRRQTIFSQYKVQHIDDYIKLYKKGEVAEPLPHLVIIVDEFAELKMAYPEFMSELVSTARIGRTLGVHLILATQKPSGQVDPQIWSNSKFRLCLKVQTKEDSSEMLKSPLAAEIKEPGRAYLQVGNNEMFELFQSAYAGAEIPDAEFMRKQEFTINKVEMWGKRELIYTNRREKKEDKRKSQLQEMVEGISGYCEKAQIKKLQSVCLPPLKDKIELKDLKQPMKSDFQIAVGIYDDPEQHTQSELFVNLAQNYYIVGSALSGKTSLLQTILMAAIQCYSTEEVNFYIVDCGNRALSIFSDSKHVGGVVLANEEEKMNNLFKMLSRMSDERRLIFAQKGLGTYESYREAGYLDVPRVVVIIDNLAAFKDYYEELNMLLTAMTRDGQSLGITYIVTANIANAMISRTQMNFGIKLALNCNETGEYSNLFGHCKMTPKEVPGRGLCLADRRILEFQAALCTQGITEKKRMDYLKDEIREENKKYSLAARKIPEVPDKLEIDMLCTEEIKRYVNGNVIIGMDCEEVQLLEWSLMKLGAVTLLGQQAGRNRFVRALLDSINRTIIYHGMVEATVIDDSAKPLSNVKEYGFVKDYTADAMEGIAYIAEFRQKLEDRKEMIDELEGQVSPERVLEEQPLLMLVLENRAMMQMLSDNKNTGASELTEAIRIAKRYKAVILCSNVENAAVSSTSMAPVVLKVLKEQKQGILFDTLQNSRFFDVSTNLKLHGRKRLEANEAYYFTSEEENPIRIKTIQND